MQDTGKFDEITRFKISFLISATLSYPTIHPPIRLSVSPFICPSIHPFIHPSIHTLIHWFIFSAKMLVFGGARVWLYLSLHVYVVSGQWNSVPFGVCEWVHW